MSMCLCVWATFTGLVCGLLLRMSAGQAPPDVKLVPSKEELEIVTYHVRSLVISRYSITTISCKIRNPTLVQKEALFSVLLPINAFISNLTIEADGRNYSSIVKEREEARLAYEIAKVKGTNAAIIHQKERETSRFRIDVTVAAKDEVVFYLSYEELLQRLLGNYTLRINVHPNYPVRDVLVDVTVHETRAISYLQVAKVPGGEDFFSAVSEWREGIKTARLQFDPDPGALPQKIPLYGQLIIQYDVERSLDAGDIQIEDGYFVHFFAPIELQHTPKHITFLIDTSGSMEGTKLDQVKDALKRILSDLNHGDAYSIVEFDSKAKRLTTARFNTVSVRRASKVINALQADGGTNIDEGLKDPLSNEPRDWDGVMSDIIVLLTDGKPTNGAQSHFEILKNARDRNKNGASIFSLGFGDDVDMDLLDKLSIQNGGYSRKIYEAYDVADQLKTFYRSLATPLLLQLKFSYSKRAVILESLTNTKFYNYFLGTELVISGQLVDESVSGIRANITGQGRNGQFTMGVNDWNTVLPPDYHLLSHLNLAPTAKRFMSRLWGFHMLKHLLEKAKAAIKKSEREDARRKALHLALQYQFVTPLTSLVVIQPDSEKCKEYEDEYDSYYYYEDLDGEPDEDVKTKEEDGRPEIPANVSTDGKVEPEFPVKPNGEVIEEDVPSSGAMPTFDLSPKIYSPYDTDGVKHPDDQLLDELQKKTYSAFNSSWKVCGSNLIILFLSTIVSRMVG